MNAALLARAPLGVLSALLVGVPLLFTPSPDSFGVAKWTALAVGSVALTGLLVYRAAVSGEVRLRGGSGLVPIGAVVAAAFIATVTSSSLVDSLIGRYAYHQGFVTFVALAIVALSVLASPRAPVRSLLAAFSVGTTVVAVFAVAQLLGISPVAIDTRGYGNVSTTLGNPNFGSAYLAIVMPALLYFAWLGRTLTSRVAAGLAAAVSGAVIVAMGSAQGPVTAAVSVATVVGLASLGRFPLRRVILVAIPLILAATAVIVFKWDAIWTELAASARAGRYGAWIAAWRMFREHPILGVGLDRFGEAYTAYQPVYSAVHEPFLNAGQAHNVILDLFADGGVILGLAYAALVLYTATRAASALRTSYRTGDMHSYLVLSTVVAMWLGYQVQALVSIDHVPLALAHWVLLALVIRLDSDIHDLPDTVLRVPKVAAPSRRLFRIGVWCVGLVALWFAIIPLRADLMAGKGHALSQAGRHADARQAWETVTGLMASRSDYWVGRGLAAQNADGADQAMVYMRRAAELAPANSRVALLLAQYHASRQDMGAALEWYDEALSRDPNNPVIIEEAAHSYDAAGEEEQARALYRHLDNVRDVTTVPFAR